MLEGIPLHVNLLFGFNTLLTLFLFFLILRNSSLIKSDSVANIVMILLTIWLVFQMLLSYKNFYSTNTTVLPPRFLLLVLPPLLLIFTLFFINGGRRFMDSLPQPYLTYLHVVRIPVEIGLYWLFVYKGIPELMTFEGRNFDILAGITAPLFAYFGYQKKILGKKVLLIWNFCALGLLINIVTNAVLAAPFAFQKFAFDQPNIAVLYFPFSWLPAFIVPAVLFCHLVSIRQLIKSNVN